jgi:hypothetical protein
MDCLYIKPTTNLSTSGTATSNAFGLYIDTLSVANTTSAYGLYVQAPTGASVTNIAAAFNGLVALGPVTYPYRAVTTSTTVVAATDYMISVDSGTSGATLTVTMPTAPPASQNQVFVVKDRTGNSAISPITISAGTAQTIDNQSSITFTNPFGAFTLLFHGTNFEIL